MVICDGLETGKKYYWQRSNGWKSFDGQEHWWEYFVEFTGFNGAGGVWLLEWHKWNSSGFEWKPQPRSLSYAESQKLIAEVKANLPANNADFS